MYPKTFGAPVCDHRAAGTGLASTLVREMDFLKKSLEDIEDGSEFVRALEVFEKTQCMYFAVLRCERRRITISQLAKRSGDARKTYRKAEMCIQNRDQHRCDRQF